MPIDLYTGILRGLERNLNFPKQTFGEVSTESTYFIVNDLKIRFKVQETRLSL